MGMGGVGREPGKGMWNKACLRMVGMRGFTAQDNSYEVVVFPMVAVFWNEGAPTVMGDLGSGTLIIYLGYV